MKKLLLLTFMLLIASSSSSQERRLDIGKSSGLPNSEKRIALVIGNSDYEASPLRNPVNDAREMAKVLRESGFEVTEMENLKQSEMKRAIRAFGAKIRQGGVGLFYYSGHGAQVNGRNFLIPVGLASAEITNENEIEYEAVDLGLVFAQMEEAGNRMNVVILDACRNNPFVRSFRSPTRGLAVVNASSGILIAYSTAPGSVASDGESGANNSPYTQALLSAIREPGLKIEDVFKKVRTTVRQKTGGKQIPWESSSIEGDFYFLEKIEMATKPSAQPTNSTSTEKSELKSDNTQPVSSAEKKPSSSKPDNTSAPHQPENNPPPPTPSGPATAKRRSLYERLGGKRAIVAVVDEFMACLAGDSRINHFFAQVASDPQRLRAFKDHLTNQICQITGGSCKYKGRDMLTTHKGMNISDGDFNAFIEDLEKALDKFHISEIEKYELLGGFGSVKSSIINK